MLLDRAESVFNGVVGGAEVGGDVANVDLSCGQRFRSSASGAERSSQK